MDTKIYLEADQELFSVNDIEISKKLFSKWVSMIEIEAFSYCNRKCWFCPNSKIDRKSFNEYLDIDVFKKILSDLASINYDRLISFSRYNEPFAREEIFEYIRLSREYLPNARLHSNSNADYITLDTLKRAIDSGLNSIVLQIYLPRKYDDDREQVEKFRKKILSRLGGITFSKTRDEDSWIEWEATYKGLRIGMRWRDFSRNGVSRADINVNSHGQRLSPCLLPIKNMYIDYNGKVMPCCNLRSDYKEHVSAILGDLTNRNRSIFSIYGSPESVRWRRALFNFNEKTGVCSSCHFASISYNSLGKELYKSRRLLLEKRKRSIISKSSL